MNKRIHHFIEKFRKKVGKTIYEYGLLKDGDCVAVALSGGIDSLVVLENLAERRQYIPISYNIVAVHVSMHNAPYNVNIEQIKRFCHAHDVELHCLEITFEILNSQKSICASCAFLRRKALFDWMKNNSFKSLAFGHHMDDAIETLFLNMVFQANVSTMPPKLSLFNGEFNIIRPLIRCTRDEIEQYATCLNIVPCATPCQHAHATNRHRVKGLVDEFSLLHPNARQNIFAAMSNIRKDYLPQKIKNR